MLTVDKKRVNAWRKRRGRRRRRRRRKNDNISGKPKIDFSNLGDSLWCVQLRTCLAAVKRQILPNLNKRSRGNKVYAQKAEAVGHVFRPVDIDRSLWL